MKGVKATPAIILRSRQKAERVDLEALQIFAQRALEECLGIPARKGAVLAKLREISVILISDRRMAELHRRFLNVTGPTDVITFQHGEIFVNTERARKQAREFATSIDDEIRLYIAHGLLHLHGFDDKEPRMAAEMERAQKELVSKVVKELTPPLSRG